MSIKENEKSAFKPSWETAKELMNESFSRLQEQRAVNSDWFFPHGITSISIEVSVDKFKFNVTVAGPEAKSVMPVDDASEGESGG